MDCWYCRRIQEARPGYSGLPASFDMGSDNPRCARHWRYVCDLCSRPSHFQGIAFCLEKNAPFCTRCALAAERVEEAFFAWSYYFRCRCPFCAGRHPTLDYAESCGAPLPSSDFLSAEKFLNHTFAPEFTQIQEQVDDRKMDHLWTENAETWSKFCGPEGDSVRRFVTDPVLFKLLGDVKGKAILDAGCGEGYLSRLLAQAGAGVRGVENARGLYERAVEREKKERLGIAYSHGSIASMPQIESESADFIVCNNVLMHCAEVDEPVAEFRRILKKGGKAILVFTHPCFWGPGTEMRRTPPDTPHKEEWRSRMVFNYFDREPKQFIHPDYGKPLIFFRRTIEDYFAAFTGARFRVTQVLEPDVIPEMRGKLPGPSLPTSIMFCLEPY